MKHEIVNAPVQINLPGHSDFRPQWSVNLQEDGSLIIVPVGRRPGRLMILPNSMNAVVITTSAIVLKKGEA